MHMDDGAGEPMDEHSAEYMHAKRMYIAECESRRVHAWWCVLVVITINSMEV